MMADKPSAAKSMHNIDSRLSDTAELVFDAELLAVVDVELLTMVADRSSAAEPMHNIDNRQSEPMFDAEKLLAVMHDD